MNEIRSVVIGIQARTTSKRFPRKVLEHIDGKPMVEHVLTAAFNAMTYLNRYGPKNHMLTSVVLLVPSYDELVTLYRNKVSIFAGSEFDVLNRYYLMMNHYRADYVVRLTADCPLIPSNLISKHIQTTLHENYDYLSNVEDGFRTAPDGMDCEVLSAKALSWLNEETKDQKEREHVTTLLRDHRRRPGWAKIGHMVGFIPLADMKLSVDTEEDLMRVRIMYAKIKDILDRLENLYGKKNVHRF